MDASSSSGPRRQRLLPVRDEHRAEDSRRRITPTPTRLKAMDSSRTSQKRARGVEHQAGQPARHGVPSRAPIISKPYRVPGAPSQNTGG